MIFDLIGFVILGLIIGALARLAIPGPNPMGIGVTILVGMAGSLIGGFLGRVLLGRPGGFILGTICAIIIVWLLQRTRPAV